MSPWWLRPTADEEDGRAARPESPPVDRQPEEPVVEVAPAAPVEVPPEPVHDRQEEPVAVAPPPEPPLAGPAPVAEPAPAAVPRDEPAAEPRDAERRGARRADGRRRGGGNGAAAESGRAARPPQNHQPRTSPEPPDWVWERIEGLSRDVALSPPGGERTVSHERKIALFCDLENVALGVRDSDVKKFDINMVIERLLEKGKIIVKRAYADWERYSDYKRTFHEAGMELIEIPEKRYSGKNSADIKMVVDAMDLCFSKEHLDTFVVLSGDSDFSPLVSKLKENNKYVIGVGVRNSSSSLLVDNCDEFVFYEDVWRDAQNQPKLDGLSKKAADAFSLMVDAIEALMRENKDVLWGSMVKQTMQRKRPSFSESYYGYSTFSELLEDAEQKNIIRLKKDQRSGSYIVAGFAVRK